MRTIMPFWQLLLLVEGVFFLLIILPLQPEVWTKWVSAGVAMVMTSGVTCGVFHRSSAHWRLMCTGMALDLAFVAFILSTHGDTQPSAMLDWHRGISFAMLAGYLLTTIVGVRKLRRISATVDAVLEGSSAWSRITSPRLYRIYGWATYVLHVASFSTGVMLR